MLQKLKTNYRALKSTAFSKSETSRENMVLERVIHDSHAHGDYKAIIDGITALVHQNQFEIAVSYVENYTQYAFRIENGTPLFFEAAQHLVKIGETEDTALSRLKAYETWRSRQPHCPFAAASLARAYREIAWVYRGSGWASSVTEDGWDKFQHYCSLAARTFQQSANFNTHWYWAQTFLGYALVDCQNAEQVIERHNYVAQIIPQVPDIYTSTAYALLPRWYGDYIEVEKFARRSADQTAHLFGDGLYAFINLALLNNYEDLGDLHIDEPRFRKGCHDWLKHFPSQYYRTHMISACYTEGLYSSAYELICGLTEFHKNAYDADIDIYCANGFCKEFYKP